jgi:hypothetical protein
MGFPNTNMRSSSRRPARFMLARFASLAPLNPTIKSCASGSQPRPTAPLGKAKVYTGAAPSARNHVSRLAPPEVTFRGRNSRRQS